MLLVPILLAGLTAGRPGPLPMAPPPQTGVELLQQMHDRYAGRWYRTLTFTQTTTRTTPAGQTHVETWYEAGTIPGKLRIDVAPIDSGKAILYVGPTRAIFRNDSLVSRQPDRNLLMTLGFDVYAQPVDSTVAQLEAEHFDLQPIRTDTWQGRPVYVVGAAAGDSTTNQFWVDQERLVFVRLIQRLEDPRSPDTAGPLLDVEFNAYQPLAGGWVSPHVVIRINGREVQREDYRDIRANVKLSPELYDTTTYHRPDWIH